MRTGYYTYKPHNLSVRKNKRRNGNLEQQAQALFKAWFVDFEPLLGSWISSRSKVENSWIQNLGGYRKDGKLGD